MRRPLTLALYLYTLAALALMGGLTFWGGHFVLDALRRADREALEHTSHVELLPPPEADRRERASAIGWAAEAAWEGDRPAEARLNALARSFHLQIRFESWPAALKAVPALATTQVVAPTLGPPPGDLWVRLDHGGHPAGALRLVMEPPHHPPHPPLARWPWFALAWGGMWALVLVPPIEWWVLRPLRRMAAEARRLGAGDLATPVPVTRPDEFGELESAFEAMRERLLALLDEKERLLGDISHELRAPLSRLAVGVRLLEGDPELIADLREEIQLMDGLIGEIMTLARGRSGAPLPVEPLDLAAVVRAALARRERQFEAHRVQPESHLAPAPVTGAPDLLERAVGNLLDNALRHGGNGVALTVSTGLAHGMAFVQVEDDGPGIPAEHRERVFEPFYRPDPSRHRETGGSGLGLAIVAAIVRRHGGRASVTERPGGGAVVRLELPAS